MWDLPWPGTEHISPALAGIFLSTVPPGKSLRPKRFKNYSKTLPLSHWTTVKTSSFYFQQEFLEVTIVKSPTAMKFATDTAITHAVDFKNTIDSHIFCKLAAEEQCTTFPFHKPCKFVQLSLFLWHIHFYHHQLSHIIADSTSGCAEFVFLDFCLTSAFFHTYFS